MGSTFTPVGSLGEFALIDRLQKILGSVSVTPEIHQRLIKGIFDDAAVFRPAAGKVQLVTTDSYAEGIHFDLTYTALRHLGWKVMAASVSDIAAMGGAPEYATVSISVPQRMSVEMLEELYEGIAGACREYSFLVAGGDTTASSAGLVISVTIIGSAEEQKVVYRNGAKPGDYLCVTGHLGASLAGLKILLREKSRFAATLEGETFTPNLEPYAAALEKHFMPRPRFDIVGILTSTVCANAMIDISDGLASEIHHICKESNVGATLFERSIPVDLVTQHIAGEFSESPVDYALYGGDEYELLFTLTDKEFEKLEQLTNDVSVVGRITEAGTGVMFVRENGETEPLKAGGWDHFKRPSN
jgi:thiamine-monophosphate kinase